MIRFGWIGLAMMAGLITAGCEADYVPGFLQTPRAGLYYESYIHRRPFGRVQTTVRRHEGKDSAAVEVAGYGRCMALTADGARLFVLVEPEDGPDHSTCQVVIFDAARMHLLRMVSLEFPPSARVQPGSSVQRLDQIAVTTDGARVALYCWVPVPSRGSPSMVGIWDSRTGRILREIFVPRDPSLAKPMPFAVGESASGLAFSADGARIALSVRTVFKDPAAKSPNGFIHVWRTADGQAVSSKQLKDPGWLHDICMDQTGEQVAGWHWADGGKSRVTVLGIPDGREVLAREFAGRPRMIWWSSQDRRFAVLTSDGHRTTLTP